MNNKSIYFYLDKVPENISCYYTYDSTLNAIDSNLDEIHTTSLTNISFYLLSLGYNIYLIRNSKCLKLYPGMKSKGNKEIRLQHNLQTLIKGHYFDADFE